MSRSPRPWTVLPHDPIEKHEPNLWTVRGVLRVGGAMDRRMAIVRLSDGRLVFYNAIPLDDPAMRSVEAWGTPAFLVVPNAFHRLDIHAFKARYPGMQLVCPARTAGRVAAVAATDGDLGLLPADICLTVQALEGTRIGEPVFVVASDGRRSVVFGDSVMNLRRLPGAEGLILRLIGSSPGPRVTRIARWILVSDRTALRAHLERLAALPGLTRLIPSHGEIVHTDAPGVLRTVAAQLG